MQFLHNINYTAILRINWEFAKDSQGIVTITLSATTTTSLEQVTLIRAEGYISSYYAHSDRLKTNGKYAFKYDNAGNLSEKGNKYSISGDTVNFTQTSGEGVEYWQYRYDLLNRLVEVKKNGTLVSEYGYDPDGLRVVKKANGQTSHFVFEGTEPIFERNVTTEKIHSYIYALGKHLARVDGMIGDPNVNKYWYSTDHLGSVRAVTDDTGVKVWDADYLAFGQECAKNKIDANFEEDDLGFTGKEYDTDIGLYYFNARWYDQELGRFISEDQENDPNSPNLYVYAANNPLIFTDPTGNNIDYNVEMMQAKDYKSFWNQENYFTDNWVLDSTKQAASRVALQSEISANGKILLPGETSSNKIAALQYLAGALDTGEYNSDTLNVIQNIQHKYNIMNMDSKPGVIDQKTFNAILSRFDEGLIGQSSGNDIKRMGVGYIFHDAAYALIGANSLFKNAKNGVTIETEGSLRFTQTTASPSYSVEGRFAGKTIGQIVQELKSGTLKPSDIPVVFIERNGYKLIENTRSALALKRAGIPEYEWNLVNKTGNKVIEAKITERLSRNNLTNSGTDVLRITGEGKNASSLK